LLLPDVEMGRYEASSWIKHIEVCEAFEDPVVRLADVLSEAGLASARVGFELQRPSVTVSVIRRLAESLAHVQIEDSFGIVEGLRLIKSSEELALIRRAAELTTIGLDAGLKALRPNVRDYTVAAQIASALYEAGSGPLYWGPIVAAGYRSGLAHSTFNGATLHEGESVFLELTGQTCRYVAPRMHTAALGELRKDAQVVEGLVTEALGVIAEAARPGRPASEVAEAARSVVEPVLDVWRFHHFYGYPIGLFSPGSWVENLGYFLRVDNDLPLQSGMVFHLALAFRRYGELAAGRSRLLVISDRGSELIPN